MVNIHDADNRNAYLRAKKRIEGVIDKDGYIFLSDRLKDVIISGSYNIYPRVVEEALYHHPAVAETIVIGVPDAKRGQVPRAYVKLREGAAKED